MSATPRSNIWKAYFFNFFVMLHLIGGVLVPFFTDWGGLNFVQIMILQSWFMLWIFLLEIPTGTVADFWGRKHSLTMGCVANVVGVILYASTPNFYIFLIAEFFWAVAEALFSGAREAFLYDTLKDLGETEKAEKVLGRFESFKLAGLLVAAPLGSLIAARFGLRSPMMLMAVPLTVAFLIALSLKEPTTFERRQAKRYTRIFKEGIGYFFGNRILQILALDMVVIGSVGYFMIWLHQPMLQQSGLDLAYFGLVNAAFVTSEILIMNNYERFTRVLGSKRRLVFFSAAVTGIMFMLGGCTKFFPLVLLSILAGGGFGLARRPLMVSYLNKHIPSEQRATVLSTISMFQKFVLVFANPLVGSLVDWSLNSTLLILGAIALIFSFISRVEESHLVGSGM